MTPETVKIVWRTALIHLLLCVRREYLSTPGCSPLKHWDQMQTRLRLAARTSETLEELVTTLLRKLQILGPGKALCSAISSLRFAVQAHETPALLQLVESEEGYLWSMVRLESEVRKAEVLAALALKKKIKNPADLTPEQQRQIDEALNTEFALELLKEANQ